MAALIRQAKMTNLLLAIRDELWRRPVLSLDARVRRKEMTDRIKRALARVRAEEARSGPPTPAAGERTPP